MPKGGFSDVEGANHTDFHSILLVKLPPSQTCKLVAAISVWRNNLCSTRADTIPRKSSSMYVSFTHMITCRHTLQTIKPSNYWKCLFIFQHLQLLACSHNSIFILHVKKNHPISLLKLVEKLLLF